MMVSTALVQPPRAGGHCVTRPLSWPGARARSLREGGRGDREGELPADENGDTESHGAEMQNPPRATVPESVPLLDESRTQMPTT